MWNALIKYNSLAAPVLLADHSGYGASHELRSMLANQRAVRYDNKRTVYSSIIDWFVNDCFIYSNKCLFVCSCTQSTAYSLQSVQIMHKPELWVVKMHMLEYSLKSYRLNKRFIHFTLSRPYKAYLHKICCRFVSCLLLMYYFTFCHKSKQSQVATYIPLNWFWVVSYFVFLE